MTPHNFAQYSFDTFFTSLSMNRDTAGLKYISSIESKDYPLYGLQFHPEKNAFEFILNNKHKNVPHTREAVLVTQYFANFFVNETRHNSNCFKDQLQENDALIYKYQPEFTGYSGKGTFDSMYFFPLSNFSLYLKKCSYLIAAAVILAILII